MKNKPDKQSLEQWEAGRNVGEEILAGIKAIRAGKGRRFTKSPAEVLHARQKAGLSQGQFATLLGVSIRTLQDWEQGRRAPNAAAQTLIKVAEKHPRILRGLIV